MYLHRMVSLCFCQSPCLTYLIFSDDSEVNIYQGGNIGYHMAHIIIMLREGVALDGQCLELSEFAKILDL